MQFLAFQYEGTVGLACRAPGERDFTGLTERQSGYPGSLDVLLSKGPAALREAAEILSTGSVIEIDAVTVLPPLASPGKIICVGLNYLDHTAEGGMKQPDYPTLFARFTSSLVAHRAPIIRPIVSEKLDYEGELVVVIGKAGRHISKDNALLHVAGYSIFNDGSVRDYQLRTPQWTMGKNFDGTGAFGPCFVTAEALPPGARGLRIQTRLNGKVMQDASTDDLVFDVATLVSLISEGITLSPGDIIVSGTPAGVGAVRNPPVFMKHGDVCEVEIEGIGVLSNPIADEV